DRARYALPSGYAHGDFVYGVSVARLRWSRFSRGGQTSAGKSLRHLKPPRRQKITLLCGFCQPYFFHSPQRIVVLGDGESGMREGVADHAIGVEIDLPIMGVVAGRTHG